MIEWMCTVSTLECSTNQKDKEKRKKGGTFIPSSCGAKEKDDSEALPHIL